MEEYNSKLNIPMQQPTSEKKTPWILRPLFFVYDFAVSLGVFLIDGGYLAAKLFYKLFLFLQYWAKRFVSLCTDPLKRLLLSLRTLLYEFTDPFSKAAGDVMETYECIRLREESPTPIKAQIGKLFKGLGGALASLCNHLLPIVACVALIFVLGRSFHQEYLLEVTCNGEVLGYIDSELAYQEAAKMVAERAVFDKSAVLVQNDQTEEEEENSEAGENTLQKPDLPVQNNSEGISLSGGSSLQRIFSVSAMQTKEAVATTILSHVKESGDGVDESDVEMDSLLNESVQTSFRLVPVSFIEKDDSESLCDKLILSLGDQIESATGLYVDNVLYGAVKDGAAINTMLQEMLAKADDGSGSVSFYRNVELREGLYPVNVLVDEAEIEKLITGKVSGKKEYTIQAGDAPYSIAAKFDLNYSEFVAMNPNIESTCYVGQVVLIAKEEAFLPILITKQITYTKEVSYTTKTINNPSYYSSYIRITQQGQVGQDKITAKVSYLDGIEVDREIVKTVRVKDPVQQIVVRGTMASAPSYTGPTTSAPSTNKAGFIWPASGTISCRWWGYYNHLGLDIAGYTGSPIWAAADGTVIYSGWKYGGYGYYILIDHGNGFRTGYMHNSALLVRVGQTVKQGQQIARMGSTGNSSGSHCHFEVWDHGVLKNPEYYLP